MKIEEITNKLGIKLNDMQEASAQAIIGGNADLAVLSPTGSGKTLAYLLPVSQLIDELQDEVQAIVIVPGRELALQTTNVLQNMGTGIRSFAAYGGRPTMDEHRVLRRLKPQVVCGTPGRLNDHLDKENIDPSHVKFVVIDEFDKCLEMGFREEMKALLRRMPRQARRILLSATDSEDIQGMVGHAMRLDYRQEDEQVPDRVKVLAVHSPEKDKLEPLGRLLLSFAQDSTIVFVNYRDSVERTAAYLRQMGFTLSAFHGGLDQKAREDALYRFVNGSANIMVSTDLGSRGLDIPNIKNIVHYHLPESEESYVHRVGRTARWQETGQAYFILSANEQVPEYVHAEVTDYEIPENEGAECPQPRMSTLYIGKGKKDKISKGDIVGFLCKKGGLKSADIGRIDVKDHYAYVAIDRKQLKSVLKRIAGEKIKGIRTIVEEIR